MKDEDADLKIRTKNYALRIIRLYCALPKTTEAQVLGKQVLRSGTSIGAHYRESQRAKIKRRLYQQNSNRLAGTR